jgi:hypothetical protein
MDRCDTSNTMHNVYYLCDACVNKLLSLSLSLCCWEGVREVEGAGQSVWVNTSA